MIDDESLTGLIRARLPDADVRIFDRTGTMDHFNVTVRSRGFAGREPVGDLVRVVVDRTAHRTTPARRPRTTRCTVWQTGPAGLKVSLSNPDWQREYQATLSDCQDRDISGSVFAVNKYDVNREFGGDAALARVRQRLASRGMRRGVPRRWMACLKSWG